jgi:hypothetical protein
MRKASLLTRLSAKRRIQTMLAGLTWYNQETWAAVKATATDPECFEDSFPQWEKMAISTRKELQRSGVRAVECHIIPQEFFEWCSLNGKANIAASRAEYVSEKLSAAQGAASRPAD